MGACRWAVYQSPVYQSPIDRTIDLNPPPLNGSTCLRPLPFQFNEFAIAFLLNGIPSGAQPTAVSLQSCLIDI